MAKNIRGFLENLTDYFLNFVVNVNFFGDLKFEYYWALPWKTATSKPFKAFSEVFPKIFHAHPSSILVSYLKIRN